MSIAPGAERVPLTGSTPPATPSPASGGPKGVKLDQKTLMMGGAVVVALIAFASSRGGAGGTSGGNFDTVELDTTETDLYTAVQPELERINDQLEDLGMRDTPAPAKPQVIVNVSKPTPSKAAPKPGTATQPNLRLYTVKRGDSLSKIAARFKVSRIRLYRANSGRIEAAAKKHGKKNSGNGRWIYPGTVLVIPK
ncbi:LysM peptidoglycan-binding domain-containing protein [Nocardioides sp.]|uniref:LysM peptidoglycan-binding domain-containing protein n=1 Tax=Nocardioides sp. TaxID=35761 RepID=UPI002C06DF4E|nr:LysM peptidoglycan-binding domain-containing protein [Nocardioides sp.]HSX68128.1 LysM peptidoglycan-binding domain-containing protein [Nocardioides sp.]